MLLDYFLIKSLVIYLLFIYWFPISLIFRTSLFSMYSSLRIKTLPLGIVFRQKHDLGGVSPLWLGQNSSLPAAAAKSLQSCPTLCDPIDSSPLGPTIPGILQARTLEWVAISFSNAWKWKMKVKSLSRVRLLVTPWTAAHQASPFMGFSRQECWSGVPLPSPSPIPTQIPDLHLPVSLTAATLFWASQSLPCPCTVWPSAKNQQRTCM